MAVQSKPEGYSTVSPYLIVENVKSLIDFTKDVFNSIELESILDDDKNIRHGEVKIGESVIMIGEARDGQIPMEATLYVYVSNVDEVYEKTLDKGVQLIAEPADQFMEIVAEDSSVRMVSIGG